MEAAAALSAEELRFELAHPSEKLHRESPVVSLRVGHFASKTQAIDVFANGVLVASAVAFGRVSQYASVELKDMARVEIRAHGGTSNNLAEMKLSRKKFASGFASLFLARDGDDSHALIAVEDPEVTVTDEAAVRFVHLSSSGALKVQYAIGDKHIEQGSAARSGQVFGEATPYKPLPAKRYSIDVAFVDAGKSFSRPAVQLIPGQLYTFVGVGNIDEHLFEVVVVRDQRPPPAEDWN